jgi:subtilisin-like proprotein convertase family protein
MIQSTCLRTCRVAAFTFALVLLFATGLTQAAPTNTGFPVDDPGRVVCGVTGFTCFLNADGSGFCGQGASCASLALCSTDADCAAGTRCSVDTCCGVGGVCSPVCDDQNNPCTNAGICGTYELDVCDAPVGPQGACCAADTCDIRPEADCLAIGGTYLGDGTGCVSDNGLTADYVSTPGAPIDNLLPPAVDLIVVAESFLIADLDVDFIATHTWIGDIVVTLEGPDGTTVVLQNQICGNVDNEDVIFDDEAGPIVCASPVTGGTPDNPLSAFDGGDALGIWTITVADLVGGDAGTLDQWSLHFDQGDSNCVTDGACCTNGPGVASDCIETSQADCEADGGLFVGGSCADIPDCLPLFVEIDSMSATKTGRGVLVAWTTTSEVDNHGFRIVRESGVREKRRVTLGFVPTSGGALEGASYQFLDNQIDQIGAGTRYWIETVDVYGRVEQHGPIELTGNRVGPNRTR